MQDTLVDLIIINIIVSETNNKKKNDTDCVSYIGIYIKHTHKTKYLYATKGI